MITHTEPDYKELLNEARQKYYAEARERSELELEVVLLKQVINNEYPRDVSWLMMKVDRQRRALHALQKKGKGHTKEERDEIARGSS